MSLFDFDFDLENSFIILTIMVSIQNNLKKKYEKFILDEIFLRYPILRKKGIQVKITDLPYVLMFNTDDEIYVVFDDFDEETGECSDAFVYFLVEKTDEYGLQIYFEYPDTLEIYDEEEISIVEIK